MDYLDKLIALRIDNDLSQKEVGKIIDKSQQGYDHIEKRRAKLAIEDFKKLCEFYKVQDARSEIETACRMDPYNNEYRSFQQRMNSGAYQSPYNTYGGQQATCDVCDLCSAMMCLNCLCNGCR